MEMEDTVDNVFHLKLGHVSDTKQLTCLFAQNTQHSAKTLGNTSWTTGFSTTQQHGTPSATVTKQLSQRKNGASYCHWENVFLCNL